MHSSSIVILAFRRGGDGVYGGAGGFKADAIPVPSVTGADSRVWTGGEAVVESVVTGNTISCSRIFPVP